MNKVFDSLSTSYARELSHYQIVTVALGIGVVVMVVAFMAKHFKTIHESMPSIRKALGYVQKKWFAEAIFKKELIDYMEHMKERMNKQDETLAIIRHEVLPNGQSSMNDAVRRTEAKMNDFARQVEFTDFKLEAGFQMGNRMYALFDRDGECTYANSVFLKFFSCTMDDVVRGNYQNLVHEDDRHKMRLDLAKAIDADSQFKLLELRMFDCNNVEHKVKVTGLPKIDAQTGVADKYFVTFEILKP